MHYIRRGAEMVHYLQCSAAKERVSLVVIPITVDRRARKIPVLFDQKNRCARGFAIPDTDRDLSPLPINRNILEGNMLKMFSVYLFVKRKNQESIDAVPVKRFRQRAGDVSQPARLCEGHSFR
jgi:hypothetical protein